MVTIIVISNNNNYTNNCSNNNNNNIINYSVNMFVVNNVLKTEHNLHIC
jgi:hypothetical protein